jgi:hypothetical protein
MKFRQLHELDIMADAVDKEIDKMRASGDSYFDNTQ